mmetsp:Transcript_16546/g.44930  ORF Transcript_16546/g.44930 Transcript_16546/m.44930 type:complete len:207 (+) Transcript_16546:867-1487(+)
MEEFRRRGWSWEVHAGCQVLGREGRAGDLAAPRALDRRLAPQRRLPALGARGGGLALPRGRGAARLHPRRVHTHGNRIWLDDRAGGRRGRIAAADAAPGAPSAPPHGPPRGGARRLGAAAGRGHRRFQRGRRRRRRGRPGGARGLCTGKLRLRRGGAAPVAPPALLLPRPPRRRRHLVCLLARRQALCDPPPRVRSAPRGSRGEHP